MITRSGCCLLASALAAGGCTRFAEGLPRAELGPLVRTGTVALGPMPTPAAEALVVRVSPEQVSVEFEAAKLTGRHEGRFEQVKGRLELAPTNLAASRLVLDVETASVQTDTPKLTRHLKSEDFFGVETYPKARLVIDQLSGGEDDSYTAEGSLQLHGIRRRIELPLQVVRAAERVRGASTFVLDRKAFGIVYAGRPDDLINDEVILRVTFDVPLTGASND